MKIFRKMKTSEKFNVCEPQEDAAVVLSGSEEICQKKSFNDRSSDFIESEYEEKPKKKRKTEKEETVPDIIYELEEDLDRELDIKAERNNLTATNVKKMIKAVITDTEVLKMIDYSLDKSTERPVYELKLTRAKTKELIGLNQNAIWNMPGSQKKSDIEVLINQELPEDSSDEEYEPHDEGSDEDLKVNESIIDDESIVDDECSESDCPVKGPISQVSNEINLDENICKRTRSKLCLSETPLEAIEQAFIPPDITTDMYNTQCDNQDWLTFLKEIYFDSNQLENETNDDENDPEYNVMVDEETEGTDIEELREDRAVKVTKKELNELMSELFEYTEMLSSDDEEEVKNDFHILQPENNVISTADVSYLMPGNEDTEIDGEKNDDCTYHLFTVKQNFLLKQQLEIHVQLLLQSFILAYKHPLLPESYASECRKRIIELNVFKSNSVKGSFSILNLEPALDLMNKWIAYLEDEDHFKSMKEFIETEIKKIDKYKKKKTLYLPELHPKLVKLCLSSTAFMYPLYLPKGGFTGFCSASKTFLLHENKLIAMGLEQFSDFLGLVPKQNDDLRKIIEFVNYYLVTAKSVSCIMAHIQTLRKSHLDNPIKEFFDTLEAPEVHHFVSVQNSLIRLKDFSSDFFPRSWEKYLLRFNID